MVLVAPYFLCLDAKKVTKKNQGQPETLRAFVRLTPHITLRKKNLLFKMIEKCIVSKFNNMEAVGIKHQGLNAEATVVLLLNQG
jgi:hypothetical protein